MNFDLTGLFQRQTQIPVTEQNMSAVHNAAMRGESANANLNLSIGQIVSGEVVAVDGDVVQVEVAPGSILQAKVEDGLSLLKGMSVSFEVSGMSDKQVALRALFQNTANIATINKALDAAEIPQTADTTSMVNAMMKEGMPIDKASIQAMYRQVAAYPQVSGADIVAMNRLEIPVTDSNVKQFADYMNMEHQIRGGVETIADSMTDMLSQLISEGKTTEAAQLMKQMTDIFMQNSETGSVNGSQEDAMTTAGQLQGSSRNEMSGLGTFVGENGKIVFQDLTGQETTQAAAQNMPQAVSLEEMMKAALGGMDENTDPEQFLNGQLSGKELLEFTNQLLSKMAEQGNGLGEQFGRLSELMQRPEIQNAIKEQIFEQWLMKPEDVADKQKVSDFYEKLSQQSGKLAEALKGIPGTDSNLMNQVTNIHQNVDFMNQLNQTMSYVQLPLKLAGETAHGDLYVYTNKKNLASDDGNVSAFLHLDMDHLGPVDVYVAMQHQNVSTQFYLKDDEMLDFIHEHIGILNERLESKGYQMNTQFSVKEKPGSVMEEIIEDHCENVRIGTYSFDMRA